MTHTTTVQLILDATKPAGVLFHTLSPAVRERVRVAGRAYMMAHATGHVVERENAENELRAALGR